MFDDSGGHDVAASSTAWTATFADLAALLLTFFVLVYSMSSMNEERWFTLADALASRQIAGDRVPAPPPATDLGAPTMHRPEAKSSSYLFAMLAARLQRTGIIVPLQLDHTDEGVLLGIDGSMLLEGDAIDQAFQVKELLRQIAGLLTGQGNAVVVRYRPGAGTSDDIATTTLIDIARALRTAGYRAPLASLLLPVSTGEAAHVVFLVRDEAFDE